MLGLFILSGKSRKVVNNIITDSGSFFETSIDGRLIVNSSIKSRVARIQSEFVKCIKSPGRKSSIVPGMISQGADIPESRSLSFCSSCRNDGMSGRVFQ